ncbi:hypothetical protein A2U01_0103924, partial [Trifolium medium]|nr:hypothetical protein [Trifolium medium]
ATVEVLSRVDRSLAILTDVILVRVDHVASVRVRSYLVVSTAVESPLYVHVVSHPSSLVTSSSPTFPIRCTR